MYSWVAWKSLIRTIQKYGTFQVLIEYGTFQVLIAFANDDMNIDLNYNDYNQLFAVIIKFMYQ
mgnify:CR=1 FL=1